MRRRLFARPGGSFGVSGPQKGLVTGSMRGHQSAFEGLRPLAGMGKKAEKEKEKDEQKLRIAIVNSDRCKPKKYLGAWKRGFCMAFP